MITALILTDDGIEPLAATLAALVPAVAAGLVADAVVLDLNAASEIAAVADGVGDEPGGDRRDEGGERRRKRLDAAFGQDQGRDHGAF